MKQAMEEAVASLKESHPSLNQFIELGREQYSKEVERDGFFHIDWLRGEFSQPLKINDEVDPDSLLRFFAESVERVELNTWKLVGIVADSVLLFKQQTYGLYGY